MTTIYIKLRNARRGRGMSQIELARLADCKQSAISMMESGRPDALSREKLVAIARLVGVDLTDSDFGASGLVDSRVLKICPIADCPANTPYVVSGQLMFLPQTTLAASTEATRCVFCGEIMESVCATCGELIRQGACCGSCGNSYISSALKMEQDPEVWAAAQRDRVVNIRSLLGRGREV